MKYKENIKYNNIIRKVEIEKSIGNFLAHDITEIIPGIQKKTAFKAGHRINSKDVKYLKRLGKKNLFIFNLGKNKIHENDGIISIACKLSGKGTIFRPTAKEGKILIKSKYNGVLKVNKNALFQINLIPEIMCASIHDNTKVSKNELLAATKIIPLFINKKLLKTVINIIGKNTSVLEVKKFTNKRISLIITGNEIYKGLVKDGFYALISGKLKLYNIKLFKSVILPDNVKEIYKKIKTFIKNKSDIIIITGGMSVDPDDISRYAIQKLNPEKIYYGVAANPGTMFQIAYINKTVIVGIPACALFNETTIFDLILPRLLIGEIINKEILAKFSHGGLCKKCGECIFPKCSFGKN